MGLRALFAMNRPETPLVVPIAKGPAVTIQQDWYLFLVSIYNAVTKGLSQPEVSIQVTASPMDYQAVIRGQLLTVGGTGILVSFSRDGITFYSVTTRAIMMNAGDIVRIAYATPPTVVFMPM